MADGTFKEIQGAGGRSMRRPKRACSKRTSQMAGSASSPRRCSG